LPGRDYPKSIFVAMALVLAVFIFPTLAIAWVIPANHISFTAGVMQAFNSFMTHFGIGFAVCVSGSRVPARSRSAGFADSIELRLAHAVARRQSREQAPPITSSPRPF
jgi:hypothetical protein